MSAPATVVASTRCDHCGAEVLVGVTAAGTAITVNAHPSDEGTVAIEHTRLARVHPSHRRAREVEGWATRLYLPHWPSCVGPRTIPRRVRRHETSA